MRKNLRFLALAGAVVCAVGIGQRARASIEIKTVQGGAPAAVVFDRTAFTGPNWFYVGGWNDATNLPQILAAPTYGLSRTDFIRANGSWGTPVIKDITPTPVTRNLELTKLNPLNSLNSNPLVLNVGVPITNLTEVAQLPLATRPIPWLGSDMDDATGNAPLQSKGTIVYETLPGNAAGAPTPGTDGDTIGCLNAKLGAEGGNTTFANPEPYVGIAALPATTNFYSGDAEKPWVCAVTAWNRGTATPTNGFGVFPLNIDADTGSSLVAFTDAQGTAAGDIQSVNLSLQPTNNVGSEFFPINEYTNRVTFLAYDATNAADEALAIDNAQVAVWADPVLNKTFVGLKDLTGITGQQAWSATSLLVVGKKAALETGETQSSVVARHAVDLINIAPTTATPTNGKALFGTTGNNIIGLSSTADLTTNASSIYNIRTMHTSTGRSYVIVNGDSGPTADVVTNGKVKTNVYALPIVARRAVDTTTPGYADFDDNGLIAQKGGKNEIIAATTDVFSNVDVDDRLKSVVGADPKYLSSGSTLTINDMQVVGDTVYVAVGDGTAGDASHTIDQGIFASTALFDEQGRIAAWTPWQRMMGKVESASQMSFDPSTQNFWYLDSTGQAVKATQWYGNNDLSGAYATPGVNANALFKALPQLPIYGVFDFDGWTTGFKRDATSNANMWEQFSMMVATGNGWVSLVQTGAYTGGVFVPARDYTTATGPTKNVFTYDTDPVLTGLKQIVTAEVARVLSVTEGVTQNLTAGWLFVGGANGLAVLCNATGNGWDSSTGLAALADGAYPVNGFAWKALLKPDGTSFTNVRKIVADCRGYLYVLTRDALYRINMKSANFQLGQIDATNFATIVDLRNPSTATPAGTPVLTHTGDAQTYLDKNADELFDCIVVLSSVSANQLFVGTTQGLIEVNFSATNPSGALFSRLLSKRYDKDGTVVLGSEKDLLFGPALRLTWFGNAKGGVLQPLTGGFSATGNLHVLALTSDWANACVYRVTINGSTVQAIDEKKFADDGTVTWTVPVDYYYKLGSFDPSVASQLSFSGPLDLVATKATFGQGNVAADINGMTKAVPMLPQPSAFINFAIPDVSDQRPYDLHEINLNKNLTDLSQLGGQPVLNGAIGSPYVFGQFGMIENS